VNTSPKIFFPFIFKHFTTEPRRIQLGLYIEFAHNSSNGQIVNRTKTGPISVGAEFSTLEASAMQFLCSTTKRPNLELKTRPKQQKDYPRNIARPAQWSLF